MTEATTPSEINETTEPAEEAAEVLKKDPERPTPNRAQRRAFAKYLQRQPEVRKARRLQRDRKVLSMTCPRCRGLVFIPATSQMPPMLRAIARCQCQPLQRYHCVECDASFMSTQHIWHTITNICEACSEKHRRYQQSEDIMWRMASEMSDEPEKLMAEWRSEA